jgi:glycerol-3-phosphate dehydrogenase
MVHPSEFDLAIVGGGIVGAGIARDAALRGLSVVLVEKSDFGGGTTAGSTRLIHGGLRYLEMLDFRLVRMDLREREILLRIATHLVKPLPFLLPFYERSALYRAKLRAGMLLYDLLSYDKSLPSHRFLTADEVKQAEPELLEEGLQGGVVYYDGQVNSPERLALENLIEARERGALTLNYTEVVSAIQEGGAVRGLQVRDVMDGSTREVRARVVVNATGAWFDRVAARLVPLPHQLIRTTKGIHLACERVSQRAVVLFSPLDGRLFFVIPWLGYSWIGTTDTDFGDDPDMAGATPDDVEYLLRSARVFFPSVSSRSVNWTNSGVRALVMKKGSESSVSRLHRIREDVPGLISVLGGKLTGYRAIAEEATGRVCRRLGVKRKCLTAETPLPGARSRPTATGHLESIYGCRAVEVRRLAEADPRLAEPLAPDYPDIAAQVVFSVRHEQCRRLSDFMLRRSLLGFTRDQGRTAALRVASWMAQELEWSPARQAEEGEAYRRWCERTSRGSLYQGL